MKHQKRNFFIVAEDVLPEALVKTAQAKDLLARGEVAGIPEAVEKLGIARSTYYKYKDGIFTFYDLNGMHIVNVSIVLGHTPGTLSRLLSEVAAVHGDILMINQSLPSHGTALVTLSVGMEEATADAAEFLRVLENVEGVVSVRIDGVN